MEHFYQTIDSEDWFKFEEFYKYIVEKYDSGAKFVEIGSWKGRSAIYLAVEIKNSNKDIKLDCVDLWSYIGSDIPQESYNGVYEKFVSNIEPVKDVINIVRSISWDAANLYENESVDVVFIDASHDHESVTKDISSWYPKLKKNGIMAGHDYRYYNGVYSAVNEYFKNINTVSEIADCCWMVTK